MNERLVKRVRCALCPRIAIVLAGGPDDVTCLECSRRIDGGEPDQLLIPFDGDAAPSHDNNTATEMR